MSLVLVVQLLATLGLVGLIWFVQLVHYPLFASVGPSYFEGYHSEHVRRTGWVTVPLMLAEAVAAIVLLAERPAGITPTQVWLGAGLVATIWLSTFLVQVPFHRVLGTGFDRSAYRGLANSNWIRTGAWTSRAAVVLWMTWSTTTD